MTEVSEAGTTTIVGAQLRAARRGQNMTLQTLSDKSGLSVGYISQIERDIATPSLVSLNHLAEALGLDLGHFIAIPSGDGLSTRAVEREAVRVREGGPLYERLHGDFPGATFSAFVLTVPAGYTSEPDTNYGEEFVELRSGRLSIIIEETEYDLGPGDTVHYRGDQKLQAINKTQEDAVMFWIGNSSTFRHRIDQSASGTGKKVQL